MRRPSPVSSPVVPAFPTKPGTPMFHQGHYLRSLSPLSPVFWRGGRLGEKSERLHSGPLPESSPATWWTGSSAIKLDGPSGSPRNHKVMRNYHLRTLSPLSPVLGR